MMALKVQYQLAKGGPWLNGVGISVQNEPAQLDFIITAGGEVIPEPYDFRDNYWHGLIIFGGFQ